MGQKLSIFQRILKTWISIPRTIRTGLLTLLVIGIMIFFLGTGISNSFNIVKGSSELPTTMLFIIGVAAAIILLVIRKEKK
ncbi:hypothetical protein IHV09_08655 [Fictibacillus sp. 23RED33]|uniref:hypothetical protein n=1 Tax=Fictibacillus sp. 23RED33 TaxID=2745879 RepID=UPI0018CD5C93|nr:hypothetical protein [Fictibacillus sp. 23RED33]MBH0173625.1 hypothetical protein [Fictibacillus sp. 23RED33]